MRRSTASAQRSMNSAQGSGRRRSERSSAKLLTRSITAKVHARGKAIIVTVHLAVNLSFTTLHLDPAISMAAQTRLMIITAQQLQRTSGKQFVSRDWSFTVPGEERMSGRGGARIDRTHLATAFDDWFREYVELHQPEYTFRRLGRDSSQASGFSRIDRLYINVHPSVMEPLWMTGVVVGRLVARSAPSDHTAVRAVFRARASPGRSVVQPEAARHPAFLAPFIAELENELVEDTAAAKLQRIICAAHVEQHRTAGERRCHAPLTEADKAEVCLEAVRRIREGKTNAAIALLGGVPELAFLCRGGRISTEGLLRHFAGYLRATRCSRSGR